MLGGVSAMFDTANVNPFKHLGVGAPTKGPVGVDAIADLKYDELKKCLHVCIVDVAAMSDIIRMAITAFFAKLCNKWGALAA